MRPASRRRRVCVVVGPVAARPAVVIGPAAARHGGRPRDSCARKQQRGGQLVGELGVVRDRKDAEGGGAMLGADGRALAVLGHGFDKLLHLPAAVCVGRLFRCGVSSFCVCASAHWRERLRACGCACTRAEAYVRALRGVHGHTALVACACANTQTVDLKRSCAHTHAHMHARERILASIHARTRVCARARRVSVLTRRYNRTTRARSRARRTRIRVQQACARPARRSTPGLEICDARGLPRPYNRAHSSVHVRDERYGTRCLQFVWS